MQGLKRCKLHRKMCYRQLLAAPSYYFFFVLCSIKEKRKNFDKYKDI
jgi:hypothetical protein